MLQILEREGISEERECRREIIKMKESAGLELPPSNRLLHIDIAFPVGVVTRYMRTPSKNSWEAMKGRYHKGTTDLCICF